MIKWVKSEKPVTTTHEKLGEIKVAVEVPVCETWEDCKNFAGGEDNARDFFNSAVETAAKNGGRAALRNLPADANLDEAVKRIQSLVHDYTPNAGARDLGKAKKAEKYDEVRALVESGKEFSREELLALLTAGKV